MNTGAVIAIVVGAVVLVFLAVNRGLVSSGVQVGVGPGGATSVRGIVAPQPSSNYGGYLAASTAPGVSAALNGAFTGLGSALAGWFSPPHSAPLSAQGSSPTSPAGPAQPTGPATAVETQSAVIGGALVGPQVDPIVSYNSTSGSAFAWDSLAADNAPDVSASLESAYTV